MQTSLARRQRHRRTIHRRPQASGGSKTVRRILIAIPIILVNLALGFYGSNISIGGHIGGLIGGALCALAFTRLGKVHAAYGKPGMLGFAGVAGVALLAVLVSYYAVQA